MSSSCSGFRCCRRSSTLRLLPGCWGQGAGCGSPGACQTQPGRGEPGRLPGGGGLWDEPKGHVGGGGCRVVPSSGSKVSLLQYCLPRSLPAPSSLISNTSAQHGMMGSVPTCTAGSRGCCSVWPSPWSLTQSLVHPGSSRDLVQLTFDRLAGTVPRTPTPCEISFSAGITRDVAWRS